jgi:8-amino-7-oxononanoate synthase
MLDFTSALYLGFQHPAGALRPWARLSAGAPAALAAPSGSAGIARGLAALQGCGAATLAPSTLHVFWDLFPILGGEGGVAIHVDAEAYPIARWGAERSGCRGVPVLPFSHYDAEGLERAARVAGRRGLRPLVVTDGVCPDCGRVAPLGAYLEVARRLGGRVVVDDTQGLGVLGAGPGPAAPYGRGGGGAPRWCDVAGPELLVAASLAKGFGVPLAALAGAGEVIERFEARSETRSHSSPPSVAALGAAEWALALNQLRGDRLRSRLARLVRHFRVRLGDLGLSTRGGLFPVQTLEPARALDSVALHGSLLERGVRTVLHRPRAAAGPRLSLLITARHHFAEIDAAVDALADATALPARGLGGTR